MKDLKLFLFTFVMATSVSLTARAQQCLTLFTLSNYSASDIGVAQTISHEVARSASQEMTAAGLTGRTQRGYAVLVGAMVGSAALTSYLGSRLPSDFQFLSIFVTQVSTLGVFVLGAPIWEPLSSRFRKWAFGVRGESSMSLENQKQLESQWLRTQENYSLNAQMSRNVLSQFLLTIRQNFYEAYRAHQNADPNYAADQVAEAAYRLRILFKDISPSDASVAAAVRAAFTHHVVIGPDFVALVEARLRILDPDATTPAAREYYHQILTSWLSPANL